MASSLCALTAPPEPKKPILLRTSFGNLDRPLPFLPSGTGFKFLAMTTAACLSYYGRENLKKLSS